jgi:glutathione reductase (NADPH)
LGLDKIGVKMRDNGAIVVDAHSRTSISSIYAVGDVTDRINLTPVAIREGHAFADSVFGSKPRTVDYDNVASAVFTTPEIGAVGLSETAASERFPNVDIYETAFRPMRATLSGRSERVYMKLVVNADSQKVLGAHLFGPEAGEMIQLVAVALQMGATKLDFDSTMAVHPTMAEELVTLRAPDRRLRRELTS